jgi:hypothetical protein
MNLVHGMLQTRGAAAAAAAHLCAKKQIWRLQWLPSLLRHNCVR